MVTRGTDVCDLKDRKPGSPHRRGPRPVLGLDTEGGRMPGRGLRGEPALPWAPLADGGAGPQGRRPAREDPAPGRTRPPPGLGAPTAPAPKLCQAPRWSQRPSSSRASCVSAHWAPAVYQAHAPGLNTNTPDAGSTVGRDLSSGKVQRSG